MSKTSRDDAPAKAASPSPDALPIPEGAKHTPGPWRFGDDGDYDLDELPADKGRASSMQAITAEGRARPLAILAALLTALQSQTPGPAGASNEGGGHVG